MLKKHQIEEIYSLYDSGYSQSEIAGSQEIGLILSLMNSLKRSRMAFEKARPLSFMDLEPLRSESGKAKRKPEIQRLEP